MPEEKDFEDFKKWWPSWIKNDEEIDGDEEEGLRYISNWSRKNFFYLDDNKESGGTAEVYFGWGAKELADLSAEKLKKLLRWNIA